jgi:MFS family permease
VAAGETSHRDEFLYSLALRLLKRFGNALARQIVPVLALLLSTAFLLAGNGVHSLLLPLRGSIEGFSTAEIGLIGTGWATGFILGCLTAPIVVRRVGHIRAFACSAAFASIIILLNGLFVIPLAWILLRAGSGFFIAGAFMIIESWLNERVTNESRGTVFAIYMMVTYLGLTAGQLGVGIGDPATSTLFMAGAILFSLAILPTALSTAASPRPLTRVRINLRKLFRNSPVASVTVFLVGIINGAFGTLAAVWGTRIGLSTPLIALMVAITVVSGAVTQIPAGRLSDRTDRRYVIAGAATAAALVGFVIAALRPTDPWLVITLAGCYGALTYPIYGLAVAHANDYADASEFIAVSGGLLLLYGAGTMVGPLAAGVAMTRLGPEALFLVTAASHVVMAGYTIFRTYRRARIPENVREAYQTVPDPPMATPATAALDPRADDATITDRQMEAAVK